MFRFTAEDLAKYEGLEPKWGQVGAVTYKRTYSRPIYDGDKIVSRESWLDTCVRVIEGNMNLVQNDPTATKEWAVRALDLMYNMSWLPPGRGLWMMGTEYAKMRGGDALNNCWYISVKPQSYENMEMFRDYPYLYSDPYSDMPSFPFVFMFDRAMLGGGVGFGVNKSNISNFPKVNNSVNLTLILEGAHPDWYRISTSEEYDSIEECLSVKPDTSALVVEDCREGWAMAVRELIDAHWHTELGGYTPGSVDLKIDLSKIRGYGRSIKGFGGTASGPLPLISALVSINRILNLLKDGYMRSIDALDIMNLLGRCVVAGNVRRTALIALGDADDKDYVDAKNYKITDPIKVMDENGYPVWEKNAHGKLAPVTKPYSQCVQELGKEKADELLDLLWRQQNHRWASNNSVFTHELFDDFHFISAGIIANGEPGIGNIWLMKNFGRIKDGYQAGIDEDAEGLNPCAEITLANAEPCNLVEVIPYRCFVNGHELQEALSIATQYAYRITFAKYSWPCTQRVIGDKHRIGVSLTGMQDYFLAKYNRYAVAGFVDGDFTQPIFDPDMLHELDFWYKYVKEVNQKHADALGSTPSIKITTIKPSGTIAKLPGVSSGLHWHYSPYLIQRIRFHETDPNLKVMEACGYPIEHDHQAPNTMVVEFPIKAPNADNPNFRCAGDVTIEEQFANQFLFAYAWADNAVSATITFKPDEVDKIEPLLRGYRNRIKSTSLLPYSGHGYVQAPWEPITKEEYERRMDQVKISQEEAYRTIGLVEADADLIEDECAKGICPIR